VHATKVGGSIVYSLKLSVVEDALLGFAESLGVGVERNSHQAKRETS